MARPDSPPPMEFFDRPLAPLGDLEIQLRFGRLRLLFAGLDRALHNELRERFGPFSGPPQGDEGAMKVDLFDDTCDYYIEPPKKAESNPVLLSCDGTRVRYLGYRAAGWFDTGRDEGQLFLARGSYEPAHRAIENYIRAAVAWQAAAIGGALVHAASAILNERGYLFYGESGAGKSTLAECNRRATIVSDDLSLLLPGADGLLELVGSPFRGTYEEGQPVTGQYRLAAGFRIIKAESAVVRTVPRIQALAELVGNLTFVADSFGARPDLFARVERTFQDIPLAHLHFRKDESYWDAIEQAGLL
jgi:hypothetical protein